MGNTLSAKQDFGLVIVGSLIFSSSLLWRDFFADVRDRYFPRVDGLGARFLFTGLITLIIVLIAGVLRDAFDLAPTAGQGIVADTPSTPQPDQQLQPAATPTAIETVGDAAPDE